MVTMKEALAQSCNVYYFQLGQLLGIEVIERYASLLGFGAKTGVELPNEVAGIVPSDQWKRATHRERWYPGDTLPVAVGQGYLVVSPIQMAVMGSAIANNGTIFKPMLVKSAKNGATGEVESFSPQVVRTVDVPAEVFQMVREFSAAVVQSGTGKAAGFKHISVGGKTGTAQVSTLGRERLHERLGDHAWFIGYAPVEKPQIVVAVIVENGGHGGVTAAPISRAVMAEFFRKQGVLQSDEEVVGGTNREDDPSLREEGAGEEGQESQDGGNDPGGQGSDQRQVHAPSKRVEVGGAG